MPKIVHPQICANCQYWECFVDNLQFPDDECGACKMHDGDVVWGDEDKCEDYKACKQPRVRANDLY